jgi:hypothetical protein
MEPAECVWSISSTVLIIPWRRPMTVQQGAEVRVGVV